MSVSQALMLGQEAKASQLGLAVSKASKLGLKYVQFESDASHDGCYLNKKKKKLLNSLTAHPTGV